MPVVDGDRVLAMISETDILFKERMSPDRKGLLDWIAHYGQDPPLAKLDARTAGEAMTTPAVTITWGRSVAEAATLMLDLGIDRLPVLHDGRLVGIVTRADLVRAFIRDDREIESEIREGIVRRFWISLAGLKVAVDAGNVLLEGEVDAQRAGGVARRTCAADARCRGSDERADLAGEAGGASARVATPPDPYITRIRIEANHRALRVRHG
jgi:CBS domain